MSAAFEMVIRSKKNPYDYEMFFSKMDVKNVVASTIDDWKHTNEQRLEAVSREEIDEYVTAGKIVLLNGMRKKVSRCGAMLYKNADVYNFLFWMSTENLRFLDAPGINKANEALYNELTGLVLKDKQREEIVLCAMGVELYLPESSPGTVCAEGARNVLRWILPDSLQKSPGNGYMETKQDGFFIYTMLENQERSDTKGDERRT